MKDKVKIYNLQSWIMDMQIGGKQWMKIFIW